MYSKPTLYCGEDAKSLVQLTNNEGTYHSSLRVSADSLLHPNFYWTPLTLMRLIKWNLY